MYPSRIIGYQDPLSWTFSKFHLAPFYELVILYKPCSKGSDKLLMYMLSNGCLLNSYKAFFHLHTWLCMSCDFTSSGCKCLFIVYASCYESCFVSHDLSIYCMMELWASLQVSILHPRHNSSWTGLPFLLGGSKVLHQWCHCTHHIILCLSTVITCSSEQVFILLCL